MHATLLRWLSCLALLGLPSAAWSEASSAAVQALTLAHLQTQGWEAAVALPHQFNLGQQDGERVSYTLQVDLLELPKQPLAIYVPKLSLSGQVFVNGHYLGACAAGTLENSRCMHRPQWFAAPALYWHTGRNEIRFDMYTDTTEVNGLSTVWVGDADVLKRDFYRWRHWASVDLLIAITWLCALLGALGFAASHVLRPKPMYFWFGMAALSNVLANVLSLMDVAIFDARAFAWLVCASRFVSVPLGFLMMLAWFEKHRPRLQHIMLTYTVLGVTVMALTDTHRTVLAILYLPWVLAAPVLLGYMVHWSWKSKVPAHWIALLVSVGVLAAALHDWGKLLGGHAFEDLYLLTFAASALCVVLGATAIGVLAYALADSEKLRWTLEDRVAQRTQELAHAHAVLLESEVKRAQIQGRELLLRDVHDGFGSQLVTAHLLAKAEKLKQGEIETLLQECIDDLYLVIDVSSPNAEQLGDMLLDFQTRITRRLMGQPIQLHWDDQTRQWPALSKTTALQIMRVLQEALANALKHAQCSHIGITASFDSASQLLRLSVVDDGLGLPEPIHMGRGLRNLTERARTLGGEVTLSPAHPGTRMTLEVIITPNHWA
jgi:signal transduction histidine kinase